MNKINIMCKNCGIQEANSLNCPKCESKVKLSEIGKTTEKGVDVNLSINLLLDALEDKYDVALLFSSDADFCPAIRYIVKNLRKKVIFCSFPKPRTNELIQCCSKTQKITKQKIEGANIGF